MDNPSKAANSINFETIIREYLKQGRSKLENDLEGTRKAIQLIAREKTKDFIKTMDRGLSRDEREYMHSLIVAGMFQSFCFGYGIGKLEGYTKKEIIL